MLTEIKQNSFKEKDITKRKRCILIASHDFKFIDGLIEQFENLGFFVLKDKWEGHNIHDELKSQELLIQADIVICEWCLGNAVWYSHHKKMWQKMFIRFHRQEIDTIYPSLVNLDAVDKMVFVSNYYMTEAKKKFWKKKNANFLMIPNYVFAESLALTKEKLSQFNLGIVGIVPKMKRLDKALDILEKLREKNKRYHLFIKGKLPEEYEWLTKRPDELDYYNKQQKRISSSPLLKNAVFFDGFGKDMPQWYQKIGFILSTSDFEAFHLSIADGAASGAIPVVIKWPGAYDFYPQNWILKTTNEAVLKIEQSTFDTEITKKNQQFIYDNYDITYIAKKWNQLFKDKESNAIFYCSKTIQTLQIYSFKIKKVFILFLKKILHK